MSVDAIVLGTAQDGGLPQPGCDCGNCRAARVQPSRSRKVACLGISADDAGFLVDATPDFPRQLQALPAMLTGIILTHGHMGHTTGLLWLGKEAMSVSGLPVWMGPRLRDHLQRNEPWASLFSDGHLVARPMRSGESFPLCEGVTVTPVEVPHRDEWSETYALEVHGPSRTLLWLPDIDAFSDILLRRLLLRVDLAFLDGTFWSPDDLPGRDVREIPHPMVLETLDCLRRLRPTTQVSFIHLNHTNPLWDGASRESAEILKAYREIPLAACGGSPVAREGAAFPL